MCAKQPFIKWCPGGSRVPLVGLWGPRQKKKTRNLNSLLFDSSDNSPVGACITLLSILIPCFYSLLSLKPRKGITGTPQDKSLLRVSWYKKVESAPSFHPFWRPNWSGIFIQSSWKQSNPVICSNGPSHSHTSDTNNNDNDDDDDAPAAIAWWPGYNP